MDYFKENFPVLEKFHPLVAQACMAHELPPVGRYFYSDNGLINLLCEDAEGHFSVHYPEDPEIELETYFSMITDDFDGITYMVGMGLGYTPRALLEFRPNMKCLCLFEPNISLFAQALHALDLREMLADNRLYLIVGKPDIRAVLTETYTYCTLFSVQIINHPGSFRINEKLYKEIYDELYQKANTVNVEGNTLKVFGKQFTDARFANMYNMHRHRLLDELDRAYEGSTAFIISGGPSLEKNIHELRNINKKALIIAVDTVLPVLIKYGVVPEFVVSIDSADICYEKLRSSIDFIPFTNLIASSYSCPLITNWLPFNEIYYTFNARATDEWLAKAMGGEYMTAGAGTVAHLALIAAVALGCKTICLVGQDLSYPDKKDHVSGTGLGGKQEVLHLLDKNEKDLLYEEGYNGDKVLTTRAWLSDKSHFETLMSNDPTIRWVNCTEGGLKIKFCEQMPLSKAIETLSVINYVDKEPRVFDKRTSIIRTLSEFRSGLLEIRERLDTFESLLRKVKKKAVDFELYDDFSDETKELILKLDKASNSLDGQPIWMLMTDLTINPLKMAEQIRFELSRIKHDYRLWFTKSLERYDIILQTRKEIITYVMRKVTDLINFYKKEGKFEKKKNFRSLYDLWFEHDQIGAMEVDYFSALTWCQFELADLLFKDVIDEGKTKQAYAYADRMAKLYEGFATFWEPVDEAVSIRFKDISEEFSRRAIW